MVVVLALLFAITLVWAFLCLRLCYAQEPPKTDPQRRSKDSPMFNCPDLPWLARDTPKYVPPQEIAEKYDSYVRQLSEAEQRKLVLWWNQQESRKQQGMIPNIAA